MIRSIGVFWAMMAVSIVGSTAECERLLDERMQSGLDLPYEEFDQVMGSGWRALADENCHQESAQLIEAYMEHNSSQQSSLTWHLFQMRAFSNDYEAALELVDDMLLSPEKQAEVPLAWNEYVLASAAFLRRDLSQLRQHRENIAKVKDDHQGNELNLKVIDRLISGFDSTYEKAYMGQGK